MRTPFVSLALVVFASLARCSPQPQIQNNVLDNVRALVDISIQPK